jgi:hypothetical protein
MVIDQRNAGASQIPSANAYTLDRWQYGASQASKITTQQLTSAPPNNFYNYLGMTVSTAVTSIGSTDYFQISQKIEANNMSDFGWGTASGQSVTVSFWAKCSNAITLCGALQSSSSPYTSYPFTFTINSANTWQYITVSIPAPASGTNWSTGTNTGIYFQINLAVGTTYSGTANAWTVGGKISATGAVSVVGTNGATWYMTGAQLEVGVSATTFDYRAYTTELQLCQRYYAKLGGNTQGNSSYQAFAAGGNQAGNTSQNFFLPFPQIMRATPTITLSGSIGVTSQGNYVTANSGISVYAGVSSALIQTGSPAVGAAGYGAVLLANADASAYISISAEM